MVLQTLQEGVNLHHARFEFSRSPMAELQARYEALKETLWNPNARGGAWMVDESRSSVFKGKDQLLGVLVENIFYPETAQHRLSSVRKFASAPTQQLVEGATEVWPYCLGDPTGNVYSQNQLLGILTFHLIANESQEKEYRALQKSALCDQPTGLWNFVVELSPLVKSLKVVTSKYSEAQLLDILVEHLYSPENARKKYEVLKQSRLWNSKKELWNYCEGDLELRAADQLIGVMVEQLFSPDQAARTFQKLKQPPFWNNSENSWSSWIVDEVGSDFETFDQLLGILVEAKIMQAGEKAGKFDAGTVALPDRRKF